MPLLFTLTMPKNTSWDGKWSGDGRTFCKTRKIIKRGAVSKIVGNHYHRFSDGWLAQVNVSVVTSSEANRALKKSEGFYGYDWMIDSIMKYGEIKS